MRHIACVALLGFVMSACGHDGPTAPSSSASWIDGRWTGIIDSPTDGPGTIVLDLHHDGLKITGTLRFSQSIVRDVPGTLAGTLGSAASPTTLDFTVTYEYGDNRCRGSFIGTLRADVQLIAGAYFGQDCVHTFTGALRATKS
jgi:hypothetical protein